MTQSNNPIIVPWDFSEIAGYALEHAIKLSKLTSSEVILAHIVSKKSEIPNAEEQLSTVISKYKAKLGVTISYLIKEGSIFSSISDIIEEKEAGFAVMGTHGMKGMQKFTGSWALKVIVGSKAPFIVIQAPPKNRDHFEKIVFPIDFKFTEKEKLIWTDYIKKFTNPKFYLCYLDLSDEGFRKKVSANVGFAQRYLADKGIENEAVKIEGKNLADAAVKFAEQVEATMMLISTTRNIRIQDYVLGADEQKIIANTAKIPVMCANPRQELFKTGSFN